MKQKYSVLIVAAIVLVLFSLIVFLAPFYRGGVFWLSYIFTLIAIVAQLAFLHVAFAGGTTARSRFYGFPIFRVGAIYLAVQLVLAVIFMLVGKWVATWIPVLLYLIVLGLAAIGLIAADNVRDAVVFVEKTQAENTCFMRTLRRNADVIARKYPEFSDVAESMHYADPVSSAASEPYERQLQELLEQVEACPDEQSRVKLKNQMAELLAQRNDICKASKTR